MKDKYVIKIDNLKEYQNTLKGVYTGFTNGVRNPFSNGYFFSCSENTIKKIRDNITAYLTKIDNGYKNIDSWLDKYIAESTNLEESLKSGSVIGITDHDVNFILSNIVAKNNAKINEATDTINLVNNKIEKTNKYDTNRFSIDS